MTTQTRAPEAASSPPQAAQGQGQGHLWVQRPQGPQRLAWHRECPTEVTEARRLFGELTHNGGYRAYRLAPGTQVHEEIKSFDPAAEEIVLLMPLQGGAA